MTTSSTSKKFFTEDEWAKKLNDVKLKKEDMNKLVMNFFVVEGYLDAAELFQKESGTEPEIDFTTFRHRSALKKAVESGNVESAIEMVDPEILDTNPQLVFDLHQQSTIELVRHGRDMKALQCVQEKLARRVLEDQTLSDEFERTVALLSFKDAHNCPVGYLLDISHRLKPARKLDAAIRNSLGLEKEPKVAKLVRMQIRAQEQLDEDATFPRMWHAERLSRVDNELELCGMINSLSLTS